MSIHFFITGTSSGIGKALTERILARNLGTITGISRRCSISHKNYEHITADLSRPEEAKSFSFDFSVKNTPEKIVFINNAARLEPMGIVGSLNPDEIITSINLNLLSPVILINNFLNWINQKPYQAIIINISSGAAFNPIDTWSIYCATKAGLEMFSNVIDTEYHHNQAKIRIFSIAPGVVDTPMQQLIREKAPKGFSRYDYFKSLKENRKLIDPFVVADQIMDVFLYPENYPTTTLRLN